MKRNQQQHKAVPEALSRGMLISDYTFAKDELFAWLNLKDDELAMYGRVHSALSEKIPQPDLIVYLYADHPVIMRRTANGWPETAERPPTLTRKRSAAIALACAMSWPIC